MDQFSSKNGEMEREAGTVRGRIRAIF